MSTSTDGILAYGYDLGEDFGFGYDQPEPDWYDEDEGMANSADRALLAAIGFTETWEHGHDGYWQREREAKERLGVQIDTYCSGNYPMYLLAAKIQRCSRGDADPVDLTLPDNADERLAWALGVLGIKPEVKKPRWLLASYWG